MFYFVFCVIIILFVSLYFFRAGNSIRLGLVYSSRCRLEKINALSVESGVLSAAAAAAYRAVLLSPTHASCWLERLTRFRLFGEFVEGTPTRPLAAPPCV